MVSLIIVTHPHILTYSCPQADHAHPLLLLGTAFYQPPLPPLTASDHHLPPTPALIASRGIPSFVCSDFLVPHPSDLRGFSTSASHPKATLREAPSQRRLSQAPLLEPSFQSTHLISSASPAPGPATPSPPCFYTLRTAFLPPSSSSYSMTRPVSHSLANTVSSTFSFFQHTHSATRFNWMILGSTFSCRPQGLEADLWSPASGGPLCCHRVHACLVGIGSHFPSPSSSLLIPTCSTHLQMGLHPHPACSSSFL